MKKFIKKMKSKPFYLIASLVVTIVIVALSVFTAATKTNLFSFAATTAIATTEAESMTLPAGASVVSDSTASNSQAVKFATNVTATGSVTLTTPATSLTVRAKGIQCQGAPQMVVKVDGTALPTFSVSSSSWSEAYTVPVNLTASTHSVSVAFINDYNYTHKNANKNCSRDLFVDKVTFFGETSNPTATPTPAISTTPTPTPSIVTCTGVNVDPGQFTQTFVNNYPAGTTFCLKAGTHVIAGNGVAVRSNDKYIGASSATGERLTIIDGQNTGQFAFKGSGEITGQQNVTVQNLVIKNFVSRGVTAGWGWTITNNELTGMGSNAWALEMNTNNIVSNNYIHDNQWYAITGGPGSNFLIENNEIARNYLCNCKAGTGEDGASKLVGSAAGLRGLIWRGNNVHDNQGHAIWSDGNVYATYENNTVENNQGIGIFHEISWDAEIRNNTVRNNAANYIDKSCWHGSQIHLTNSQNVKIYGNTVEDTRGGNGICLLDYSTRSETAPFPTSLASVSVYDNNIRMTRSLNSVNNAGLTGMMSEFNRNNNISFNGNRYYVKNTSESHWAFNQTPLSWTTFKSKGQESTGSLQQWLSF